MMTKCHGDQMADICVMRGGGEKCKQTFNRRAYGKRPLEKPSRRSKDNTKEGIK